MNNNSFLFKLLEFYGTKIHHRGKWRVHAWLRKILKASVDEEFQVLRSGLMWRLNPSNYVESELFWLGSIDVWEIYHINRLHLSPGCVIFDIGANYGYYSCKLASILKKNCKIYSFEPFPSNYERLTTNISLNNMEHCIQAHSMALSYKEATGSMRIDPGNTGTAHITGNEGDIVITTLDHFCYKTGIENIDFLKIDVEGFELFLLQGGEKTIRHSKPVILMELNPPTLKRHNLTPQDVVDTMTDYGYFIFVPNRQRLEKLDDLPAGVNYINVFCLHRERMQIDLMASA